MTSKKDITGNATIKWGQPDSAAQFAGLFKGYITDTLAGDADLADYQANAGLQLVRAAAALVDVKSAMISLMSAALAAYNPDPDAVNVLIVTEHKGLNLDVDPSAGGAFRLRSGHTDIATFTMEVTEATEKGLTLTMGCALSPAAVKAAGLLP